MGNSSPTSRCCGRLQVVFVESDVDRYAFETDDLGHRDDQNAEHQMTHHLRGAGRLDGSAAVIVFEVGVDPFGAAAFVVADVVGRAMAHQP